METDFGLTMKDCEAHIEGYKQTLLDALADTTQLVEMVIVDAA
jgi:hypothetical protein